VSKWRSVVAATAVLTVIAAGCNGTTNTTTSTTTSTTTTVPVSSSEDVVFGEGELPATIPAEFPLPAGAVVGTTMVITKTGFTEVIIRAGSEQGVMAEFFNQSLDEAGFSIDLSEANGNAWLIEFSQGDARGTIDVSTPAVGISQAVIRYNVP